MIIILLLSFAIICKTVFSMEVFQVSESTALLLPFIALVGWILFCGAIYFINFCIEECSDFLNMIKKRKERK